VQIFNVQDRTSRPEAKRPFVVRWRIDGEDYSEAFEKRKLADDYRARLLVARADGERFDRVTGEPVSWVPSAGESTPLLDWARRWVAEQWDEWAPRTRKGNVYSLARFLPLATIGTASKPPAGLRRYLVDTLRPGAAIDTEHPCERWLSRWCAALGDLNSEMLSEVLKALRVGDAGQLLAASSVGRWRRESHSCIRRAVELGVIPADPWPPPQRGRNRRKAVRKKGAVNIRLLPGPTAMVSIIDSLRSHQPASRQYQVMTATVYYAGLRPSEVAMLRPKALQLPGEGWGWIEVTEADDGWDEPVEPKTGDRRVPIPPRLVRLLRKWIEEHSLSPDELLFRTRYGNRPSESNWSRAMGRACRLAGHRRIRVYDVRHAAATAWLRAGVPLGDVATRLGHSVETLVSTYVGALQGDNESANQLLDRLLATTRDEVIALAAEHTSRGGWRPGARAARRQPRLGSVRRRPRVSGGHRPRGLRRRRRRRRRAR
jgi:integrase